MSLTKNIGIGRDFLNFSYGIDFSQYDIAYHLSAEQKIMIVDRYERMGILLTREELEKVIKERIIFGVSKLISYNYDVAASYDKKGLCVFVDFVYENLAGEQRSTNFFLLTIYKKYILVHEAWNDYIERLKMIGYQEKDRDMTWVKMIFV